MKTLSCRDAGMDCDWSVQSNDENEILAKAAEHAKQEHGFQEVNDEMKDQLRSKIHEVRAA